MTAEVIPDLWGPISPTVVSPVAVLRSQASRLAGHTNGLLTADIRTATDATGVNHTFQLVAPILNGYRYELFSASHGREFIYPVRVAFGPWQSADIRRRCGPPDERGHHDIDAEDVENAKDRTADSAEEFIRFIADILQSGHTRAVTSSLIAKSNEFAAPPAA